MILLANGVFPDALAQVRAAFDAIHASSSGGVLVLEGAASGAPDPRKLLPTVEAVIDWVMEERGERRQGSPYR